MTTTPKEKFIRHLKKTMVHGETATERVEAQKLYARMSGLTSDGGSVESIPLPELPLTLQKTPSEYDETLAQAMRESYAPRGLFCLLMLVKPQAWMQGLWSEQPNGWTNSRDGNKLLGWDAARALVSDRIKELGLDAEKVYAYLTSHPSWQEERIFLNLPFVEQINQFRGE